MKIFLRFTLLLCLWAASAFSVDFSALKPEGYVSDFARVLDPASRMQLEQYCSRLEKSTGAQLAIVTLPTLDGEPVEDVANSLFRKWGIGKKGSDEGVLLLLAIQDRRSRLEVGYGLEPIIPDGFDGSVLRAMRPYLRQNQFGAALTEGAMEIGARIAQAKNVSIEEPPAHRARPRRQEPPIPVMLLFGGIIGFFLLASLFGRGGPSNRYRGGGGGGFLPGLILGNVLGNSMGWGRSRGGFGGFDSSDGFGGFGGGDSGGGGASSSW